MIFRSTEPNISIPSQPITSIVLQRAIEFADKPAMIDGLTGRTLKKAEGRGQKAEGSFQMGIRPQLKGGNLKKLGY
ncbi:MAG: hypothetical protein DSM106950_15840 [Stigonema ocellatum SAG 48.90 = DSM 106950]|nr:hypothetical protein [Stigonema ocellatum SAG 48.90 = DSM 106950]